MVEVRFPVARANLPLGGQLWKLLTEILRLGTQFWKSWFQEGGTRFGDGVVILNQLGWHPLRVTYFVIH